VVISKGYPAIDIKFYEAEKRGHKVKKKRKEKKMDEVDLSSRGGRI